MKIKYVFTTQRELRTAFWLTHPELNRRKIKVLTDGRASYYKTDTRCAFVDWIDRLERNGDISSELAFRATL